MSSTSGDGAGRENEWHAEHPLFEHSPLPVQTQEMRLLKVLPELTPSGLVCCEMEHARIDGTAYLAFDTVSYMWGSDLPRNPILVNGYRFTVRENLWDFLNTARDTRPHQWLWIDALSIAQTNNDEKEQQIRLMRDIYKLAESVLIWLGSGDKVIEKLMQLTEDGELSHRITSIKAQRDADKRRIAANIPNSDLFAGDNNIYYPLRSGDFAKFESVYGDDYGERDFMPVLDDLYYGDNVLLHGMYALDHLPYWSRVWIIQEVLLASKRVLLYGKWSLSWQQYRTLMQLFRPSIIIGLHLNVAHDLRSHNGCYQFLHGNDSHAEQEMLTPDKFDLVAMLRTFHRSKCALPYDHVYGMLAASANIRGFPVDYDSGPVELLVNTTLFCLTEQWVQSSKTVVRFPEIYGRDFPGSVAGRLLGVSSERDRELRKLIMLPTEFHAGKTLDGGWMSFTISRLLRWFDSRINTIGVPEERSSSFLTTFARHFDELEQNFSTSDIVYFEPCCETMLIVRETPFGCRVIGRVEYETSYRAYPLGMEFSEPYILCCDVYGREGLPGPEVHRSCHEDSHIWGEQYIANADLSVHTRGDRAIDKSSDDEILQTVETLFDCFEFESLEAQHDLQRQLFQSAEAASHIIANIHLTDIRAVVILLMLPCNKATRETAIAMMSDIHGINSLKDVKCFGIYRKHRFDASTGDSSSENYDCVETMAADQAGQSKSYDVNKYIPREFLFVSSGSKYLDFVTLRNIRKEIVIRDGLTGAIIQRDSYGNRLT